MARLFKTQVLEGLPVDWISVPSPNRRARIAEKIELLVLHSMGFGFDHALKILTDPEGSGVSAHFFIPNLQAGELCPDAKYPERAPVLALVPVEEVAFHAGESAFSDFQARFPSCARSLNDISVGIEFHAPGAGLDANGNLDVFQFATFSDAVIQTGLELVTYLVKRLGIQKHLILGHSDIAPLRKTDPGPLFPYSRFLAHGFGPNLARPEGPLTLEAIQAWLRQLGYPLPLQAKWEETEPFFKVLLHKLDCVEDYGALGGFPLSFKRAIGFIEQKKRK